MGSLATFAEAEAEEAAPSWTRLGFAEGAEGCDRR
jgi:hypothetical protein